MEESMKNDILKATVMTLDAARMGGRVGYLTVDLDEKNKIPSAYFRDMESGAYTRLKADTKVYVVVQTELGIGYFPITGEDVSTKKDRYGYFQFAGRDAIYVSEAGVGV